MSFIKHLMEMNEDREDEIDDLIDQAKQHDNWEVAIQQINMRKNHLAMRRIFSALVDDEKLVVDALARFQDKSKANESVGKISARLEFPNGGVVKAVNMLNKLYKEEGIDTRAVMKDKNTVDVYASGGNWGGADVDITDHVLDQLDGNYMRREDINESASFTPQEKQQLRDEDISDDLMDKLIAWVIDTDPTWMPYGTQKARDGDPYNWIMDHIHEITPRIVGVSEGVSTDEKEYGVFARGGSVGGDNTKPWKTGTKEDMMAYAKRLRKQLSAGEKGYYRMGYNVRPIKK